MNTYWSVAPMPKRACDAVVERLQLAEAPFAAMMTSDRSRRVDVDAVREGRVRKHEDMGQQDAQLLGRAGMIRQGTKDRLAEGVE